MEMGDSILKNRLPNLQSSLTGVFGIETIDVKYHLCLAAEVLRMNQKQIPEKTVNCERNREHHVTIIRKRGIQRIRHNQRTRGKANHLVEHLSRIFFKNFAMPLCFFAFSTVPVFILLCGFKCMQIP